MCEKLLGTQALSDDWAAQNLNYCNIAGHAAMEMSLNCNRFEIETNHSGQNIEKGFLESIQLKALVGSFHAA